MTKLTIGSREFAVETTTDKDGRVGYVLTGKRGAQYRTMRNANRPEVMFLVDCRGFGMAVGYERIRIVETPDGLRVARAA